MGKQNPSYLNFKALGGENIAITVSSVEVTDLIPGAVYRASATEACVIRFDATNAAITDTNFTIAMTDNSSVIFKAPGATINVIEAVAGNDGILFLQQLEDA